MSEEIDILKIVCRKLDHEKIPYMITGSFAANFYAVPRMTRDLDIVVAIQMNDVDKIFHLFRGEFYVDRDSIIDAIRHHGMFNIIHSETVFKIDFIVQKDTTYRFTEFERKQQIALDGTIIWIVSPEDLIISKLDWAKESFSEMQLKDIRNLFNSLPKLDLSYINRWVKDLNLSDIYAKVTQNE